MIWEIIGGGIGTSIVGGVLLVGLRAMFSARSLTRRETESFGSVAARVASELPGAEGLRVLAGEGLATEELWHPGLTAWMRGDGRGVTGLAVERAKQRNPELPDWREALERIVAAYAAVEWERSFATLAAPARAQPERIGQVSESVRDTPTYDIDSDEGIVGTHELPSRFEMRPTPHGAPERHAVNYNPARPNPAATMLIDREIERLRDELARARGERQTSAILTGLHELTEQRRRVVAGLLD